jgi:site-specific DNA-methyltransferase (adenine-specific)
MTSQIINFGDCLVGMSSIPSSTIDLIITDPPYEFESLEPYLQQMMRVLKPTGSLYIFGDKNMIADKWFSQVKMPNKELLIWHYKNSPKIHGRWRMSMQPIIYGFSDGSVFHEDEARIEYLPSTKKLNGRLRPSSGRLKESKPYDTSKGALPRDVIEHPALLGHLAKTRTGHRDEKPLGLIEKLMKTSSNSNDMILDPFSGSGTTLVAAMNTGRNAIGFEKDPKWFSVIQKRLKKQEEGTL